MIHKRKCPRCIRGEVTRSEGRLEQSGSTYLPTSIWSCDVCGYVHYEPATSARWRSLEAAAPSDAPVDRREAA